MDAPCCAVTQLFTDSRNALRATRQGVEDNSAHIKNAKDKPMTELNAHNFRWNDETLDLSKVMAFEELPRPVAVSAPEVALTVLMADGSNRTIHGTRNTEAFSQAMESYLGFNLI